jgi:hypothetical protein
MPYNCNMIPPSVVLVLSKTDGSTSRASEFSPWSSGDANGNYYVSEVGFQQCDAQCNQKGSWSSTENIKKANIEVDDVTTGTSRIAPILCVNPTRVGSFDKEISVLRYDDFSLNISTDPVVFDANIEHGYEFAQRGLMNKFKMVKLKTPDKNLSNYVARVEKDEHSLWCDPNRGRYCYDFAIAEDDHRVLCLRLFMTMMNGSNPAKISQNR